MHNTDRTQLEASLDTLETNQFEFPEEMEVAGDTAAESPFDEVEEMELASGVLEITDEAELDQFLGDLIKKAGRAAGRFVKSPVGRQLGGILKGAARQALPIAGKALGAWVGGPAGAAIGGQLASAAGRAFGLELEGLSPEDQEFEVARQFVRFAGAAAQRAALTSPTVDPRAAARAAVVAAARSHAPGLLRVAAATIPTGIPTAAGPAGRSGRWIRRGRKIILLGV